RRYAVEAKDAKQPANQILVELEALHFYLERLRKLLASDSNHDFQDTSVLVVSTHACKNKLTILHDKLKVTREGSIDRMLWPLRAPEHKQMLQELSKIVQWISFTVSLDGCSLLRKTSAEVVTLLNTQAQNFESLSTTAEATHLIVTGIQDMMLDDKEANHRKEILRSLVVDHLREVYDSGSVAIAHVYFDYRDQDQQTVEYVTASLLKQVANAQAKMPLALTDLHRRLTAQDRLPQHGQLVKTLLASCRDLDRVFFVIDALDECRTDIRRDLLNLIADLSKCGSIIVTSRPFVNEIAKAFSSWPCIEVKAHNSDLERYILDAIDRSETCYELDRASKLHVAAMLSQRAQHMFLLAVLHVQTVLAEPTLSQMMKALDRLPDTLSDVFDETLQRIRRQGDTWEQLALHSLLWISHARRPLKIEELADALALMATSPNDTAVDKDARPAGRAIVQSCQGLVTIDQKSGIIRLVHFSLQDHLAKSPSFQHNEATIAELCLRYQMLEPFSRSCFQGVWGIKGIIKEYPLSAYVAREWGFHVRASNNPRANELAFRFLQSGPPLACSHQMWQFLENRSAGFCEPTEAMSCNGLHMAARFGIRPLAEHLLDIYHVDTATYMGRTALIYAAYCGHSDLVELFLAMNADPVRKNQYGFTALHSAALAGHACIIRELLSAGVNVNPLDNYGQTPLLCAAASGHTDAMDALLQSGADVNATCRSTSGSILSEIILWPGSLSNVRRLLTHGVDPNVPDAFGNTPLHLAVNDAIDNEVIKLLIEHGAGVDLQNGRGDTPLIFAASCSEHNEKLVSIELLLACGADINHRGYNKFTPLYHAVFEGNSALTEMLLNRGADPNLGDDSGHTPLHIAILHNFPELIKMLLEAGADVDTCADDGRSPLNFADAHGPEETYQLLLDHSKLADTPTQAEPTED
ncbi:MAG: hypothetical protein Q9174_005648, partial [Haloplaca sp. 1 TL-2023]